MRTLEISAKCSDLCSARLNDGDESYDYDGYAPDIEGLGGGDYVRFTVDLDTGQVLGWKVPTTKEVKKALHIKDSKEEDFNDINNDPYFNDLKY
jgi:hypothetical protein